MLCFNSLLRVYAAGSICKCENKQKYARVYVATHAKIHPTHIFIITKYGELLSHKYYCCVKFFIAVKI